MVAPMESMKESYHLLDPKEVRLDILLKSFLDQLDIAPASRKQYLTRLLDFLGFLRGTHELRPTFSTVVAYKTTLAARGLSPDSINGRLTAIRRFFKFLAASGLYADIAAGLKGVNRAKGFRKDCLLAEQCHGILARIDRSTLQGRRDFALINLLMRCGLRTCEVIRAQIGDLHQTCGQARLYVQGKGHVSKDEFVILTPEALQPIHDYLAMRTQAEDRVLKDEDPLFAAVREREGGQALSTRTLRYIVKRAMRAVGLDSRHLSAHSLRHTAATLALSGGAELIDVQAMLRHRSIVTTQVYTHTVNRGAAEAAVGKALGEGCCLTSKSGQDTL